MYLHLGNNCVIRSADIIGIFDIRKKRANVYKNFLKPKLQDENIIDLSEKYPPASCIVTTDTIVLSGISSLTLKNRQESFSFKDLNKAEEK